MITKEQALTADSFIQVSELLGDIKLNYGSMTKVFIPNGQVKPLDKVISWRRNGKTQTWKTRPDDFKVPIKHGLYSYGYITQDNAHLFEVKEG